MTEELTQEATGSILDASGNPITNDDKASETASEGFQAPSSQEALDEMIANAVSSALAANSDKVSIESDTKADMKSELLALKEQMANTNKARTEAGFKAAHGEDYDKAVRWLETGKFGSVESMSEMHTAIQSGGLIADMAVESLINSYRNSDEYMSNTALMANNVRVNGSIQPKLTSAEYAKEMTKARSAGDNAAIASLKARMLASR